MPASPVKSVPTESRIIELKPGEAGGRATVIEYRGSYEDYLARENAVLAAA